jgi:glycine/D-amino acid oxidase-like deaminating enzyme
MTDFRTYQAPVVAGSVSHWLADMYGAGTPIPMRPSLQGTVDCDVCVVGAGYTGLWTAYELACAAPELSIVVLEARIAGFGASGRNGGAVIAQLNGSRAHWTALGGPEGAVAMERELQAGVDAVGAAVAREEIDCGFSKNGVVMVARTPLELERFAASVDDDREWGFGPEDSRMLDAAEVAARIRIDGALGARFSPHCASMHPGRLVRGLAEAVEKRGVRIFERSPVWRIRPGVAEGDGCAVRARWVLRATEAYTESIFGTGGQIVPVHTSMLVTEPLSADVRARLGWDGREALLAEHPFLHLQHTADGRITIGGDDNRVPYRYGSKPDAEGPARPHVAAMYERELHRLFPALEGVRIERSWQGVFGAPRTWAPSVRLDRATGLGVLGGYVGEGVTASNLAARTMRDLLLDRETSLTRLPWVDSPTRRWEVEPLRTIGAGLVYRLRAAGDRRELATGRPSRLLALGNRLAGYSGHLG